MPDTNKVCAALPVFTSPQQQLKFYADDPTSFQQILTIFNPYEFTVFFRVLVQTLDTSRYTLDITSGAIKTHCRQLIIVQHNCVTSSIIGVVDKIKIVLSCKKPGVTFRRKELPMILLPTRRQSIEHVFPQDISDYLPYQPTEVKTPQSSKTQTPVPETKPDADNDFMRKLQGYIIAFMLGVIACYYWKS